MKIAKKVLAVVMAVAMIACLSAMAFAADKAVIKLVPGEVKDGKVKVAIVAENCKGLTSADLTVSYDANALGFKAVANGADAKKVLTSTNTFSGLGNGATAGTVKYSFNFLESLDVFPDEEGENIAVDANNFEVAVITFEVKGDAANTEIKLEGAAKDADATVEGATVTLKTETVTEATTEAATEATTEAIEVVETTAEANVNTGDKTTGDNMALAAAAGVIALAGAAFIVSKKRK